MPDARCDCNIRLPGARVALTKARTHLEARVPCSRGPRETGRRLPLSAATARDRLHLLAFGRWLRLTIVLALLPAIFNAPTVLSQVRPGASLTVVQGSVSVTQSDGTKIYPA